MNKPWRKGKHTAQQNSKHVASTDGSRGLLVSVCIFSVALLVRLLYLYESSDNPTFDVPIVDAQGYDKLARLLAEARVMPKEFFWQGFFYPFFLAGVYTLSGSSILFAKILQAVLGSFTCLLTYKVGQRIFGNGPGILAGIMAAFYGPLIFYDGELLSTGWEAFWSVALVLLFLKATGVKSYWFYFALGLCAGLSAVTRIVFLPFVLAGCIWLVITLRKNSVRWRFIIGVIMSILAGIVCVTTRVATQNSRVTGWYSIQPANASLNLYLGNNPDTCATLTARPGPDYIAIVNLPSEHGINDVPGKQRFFYRKVVSYAANEPFDFLKGLVVKTIQFINSREIPNTSKIYLFRKWSLTLRILVWKIGQFGFPFGLIFPLAVCGLVACRRQQVAPLALFLLLYSLSIISVHVNDRYRLPVVPSLCVLASAGCLVIFQTIRQRSWRRLTVLVVCSAAIILLATLPGPFCLEKLDFESELYYAVANYRNEQGQSAEAIKNYLKALQIKSDYAVAHNNLAAIFSLQGKTDRAVAHYSEAVRFRPNWAGAHENLADALVRQGNMKKALKQYNRTLELDPNRPDAHINLAAILIRDGKIDQAATHYRHALRLKPDVPAVLNSLARILATSENETIRNADEAVLLAERACKLVEYKNASILDTLAAAYAAAGRFPEAVATGQKALGLAVLSGEKEFAENIRSNLELYKANQAIYTGPR